MKKNDDGIFLSSPMLIENLHGKNYYLLPSGTALYFNKSMPEGYVQYIAYFNYKGAPLQGEPIYGAVNPAWIYAPEKNEASKLIGGYPLTKDELKSILKTQSFTREELFEIINSI